VILAHEECGVARDTFRISDLNAALACCGKTFDEFCAEVRFDRSLCEGLRDSPNKHGLRRRSINQITNFVGENCKGALGIKPIRGIFDLW
jgi:hypothetical protein